MMKDTIRKICKDTLNIEDVGKMKLTSEWAEERVLNPDQWQIDIQSIVDSIKKYGFIPSFLGQTTHRDSEYWCPSSFVVGRVSNNLTNIFQGTHRLMAARLLGLTSVEVYYEKECEFDDTSMNYIIRDMNLKCGTTGYCDLYQSWSTKTESYIGRDNSKEVFNGFHISNVAWPGRTVLDIASNTGFFGMQAAIKGAKVAGFDLLPQLNKIANDIAKAYDVDAEFNDSEFWDWDWSKQYDIVFCNQAIYHFSTMHRSKCLGTVEDVFDKICNSARVMLLMYTFVDVPAPIDGEGYYPTETELREDLEARGFKTIIIEQRIPGHKSHVIASRWGPFEEEVQ